MATRIYNTTTGEIELLECVDGKTGCDFLGEVIGGVSTPEMVELAPDGADFAMADSEVRWWETWARNEERIDDAMEGRDDVPCFYDGNPDWGEAQAQYAEFLGIEIDEF